MSNFPPLPNPSNQETEVVASMTEGVYLPLDGSEAMTGDLLMKGNWIWLNDQMSMAASGTVASFIARDSPGGSTTAELVLTAGGVVSVLGTQLYAEVTTGITATAGPITALSGDIRTSTGQFVPYGNAGTAADPSYRGEDGGNDDTGMFFPAVDALGFSAGSVELLRLIEDTNDQVAVGVTGSTSVPALTYLSDLDTGLSWTSADVLDFVVGGVQMLSLIESTVDQVAIGPVGSTTVPNLATVGDLNTGLSLKGSDAGSLIAGGAEALVFSTSRVAVTGTHFFSFGYTTELTIATGVITATQSHHTVDTESNAASDDLDTINGGEEADWLVLRAEDNARTVVLKHATGNLYLAGGTDFSLDHSRDKIVLINRAGNSWHELSRSDNG